MTKEEIKAQARYWLLSAEHDYETMIGLFKIKRYSDTLFYGHIVLEKILKALAVAENKELPPMVHDLTILAESAKIKIGSEDKTILTSVNHFNIRSRYPDLRLKFYKICDYGYTVGYLHKIISLYEKLCQHPKLKSLLDDSSNS